MDSRKILIFRIYIYIYFLFEIYFFERTIKESKNNLKIDKIQININIERNHLMIVIIIDLLNFKSHQRKDSTNYRSTDDQRGHEQCSRRDKSGRDQRVR